MYPNILDNLDKIRKFLERLKFLRQAENNRKPEQIYNNKEIDLEIKTDTHVQLPKKKSPTQMDSLANFTNYFRRINAVIS